MKFKNITIFTFLTLTILTGCNDKEKIDEKQLVQPKTQAAKQEQSIQESTTPVFNLKTHDGKDIQITADAKKGWKFKGYENKVILLDFFGTWCPPCKAEIPHLNNVRNKLKENFEIIGIDIGNRDGSFNTKDAIDEFKMQFDIKYPVTITPENINLFRAVSQLNPSGSIPFMILFNKKGEFVQYYVGMKPEEMLQSDIEAAIKMK
jgi:thiol-disulfide isomerase/thioredoxin